jgi:hypothetical protein
VTIFLRGSSRSFEAVKDRISGRQLYCGGGGVGDRQPAEDWEAHVTPEVLFAVGLLFSMAGIVGLVGCGGRTPAWYHPSARNATLWSFLDSRLFVISILSIAGGGTLLWLSYASPP